MELSEETIAYLRDEAYALLCREALQERLALFAREKATLTGTRPPFGLFARKETRDAFARSMRTALDNEVALRDRLARIEGIIDWVRPLIRNTVSGYLASVSPSYCRLLQIAARCDDWEVAFQSLPELLLAFARELRGVGQAAGAPGATSQAYAYELTLLRGAADRLERHHNEVALIERAVAELVVDGRAGEIRLPLLPDCRRLAWVARLAVLPLPQVLSEVTPLEREVRTFIADGPAVVAARLQAARDVCSNLAENDLEQYWNQLRAHARQHYVEARDVDDVLAMLSERYVNAEMRRRQHASTVDLSLS